MEKNLKLFMFVNDLESEDTNKYIKLIYKDKVVAFVDKESGDVLKKKTKDKPSITKMGNIYNVILWRIVQSTGNCFRGKVMATPTLGENKILSEENGRFIIENTIKIEDISKLSDKELRIRNSNVLMNLKKVE